MGAGQMFFAVVVGRQQDMHAAAFLDCAQGLGQLQAVEQRQLAMRDDDVGSTSIASASAVLPFSAG